MDDFKTIISKIIISPSTKLSVFSALTEENVGFSGE